MAQKQRFRSFLYKSSARTFATGDLISLNIMRNAASGFRVPALNVARLYGDLASIRPQGQGIGMRVRRRISGRIAGRLGHMIIPQRLGFASRLMNKYYGRLLTKNLNNYFNQKVKYSIKLDGAKMTETTAAHLTKNLRKSTAAQYRSAKSDLVGMGINIEHFNPAEILRKIQLQMIGGATGGRAAPIVTGRLVNSIRLRGFTRSKEAILEGNLTIGGSESSPIGGWADDAPYWWKTNYGGWYEQSGPDRFIPARYPFWFGKATAYGISKSLPKGTKFWVDNGEFSQVVESGPNMPYLNLTILGV